MIVEKCQNIKNIIITISSKFYINNNYNYF